MVRTWPGGHSLDARDIVVAIVVVIITVASASRIVVFVVWVYTLAVFTAEAVLTKLQLASSDFASLWLFELPQHGKMMMMMMILLT